MYPESSNSHEVEKIISAILDRKYSWACVLMLRMTGRNPSEYIPYRTYTRILKDQISPKKKKS